VVAELVKLQLVLLPAAQLTQVVAEEVLLNPILEELAVPALSSSVI
jgi:hypothetical protein